MSKSTDEIRQTFLNFFHSKGHQIIASSSLVPNNDPTLLFTNAGLVQFKNVFLGKEKPDYTCATSAQRCLRAGGKHNDLNNVGYTARHHTFFEMLGNFSFGHYFKKEAIFYAWELLTSKEWFNLPKNRLWITVYESDKETYDLWCKNIDISHEHIIRIGDNKGGLYESDNFWQMADTGPCGPCTEIFYDHGPHISGNPPGSTNGCGDRYTEIWNIVFIQFNRQHDGTMELLPNPSVDTGMGLERIAAVLQGVYCNYEIDIFKHLISSIAHLINITDLNHASLYVIADHIRSSAFLIADGVLPSNEHRGYVLRRIIRRAIRHGYILGLKTPFFYKLLHPLIQVIGTIGNHLKLQKKYIECIIENEENLFLKTLDRGLLLLDTTLKKLTGKTLDGETVFRLYDTFGFPVDLTEDICREHNINIDHNSFEIAMQKQRQTARLASHFSQSLDNDIEIKTLIDDSVSIFKGYETLNVQATVKAIFNKNQKVDTISSGQHAMIILDKTPFYGESGGQIGDMGTLSNQKMRFSVQDTKKYNQTIIHIGKMTQGTLYIGDCVSANVEQKYRMRICMNHSATHLLHAALRQVFGQYVIQKGSLVTDKYLRFDFSYFEKIKNKQIYQLEEIVNYQIQRNLKIQTSLMTIDDALKKGALALFTKKYKKNVRVLEIKDFSMELCGGTHVKRTGDIGLFHIQDNFSIAANTRRIQAVTGQEAIKQIHIQHQTLEEINNLLNANKNNLREKIYSLLKKTQQLEKKINKTNIQQSILIGTSLLKKTIQVHDVQVLVSELNVEPIILHLVMKKLKNELQTAVIVLGTLTEKKVLLIAGVTKDLIHRINANDLINKLAIKIEGKGGGNATLAHAQGSKKTASSELLISVQNYINTLLV